MADNKKNEILEEQRRAREEFLKLKKMQQGEISAGPKPSEVAIVPKTPKEKLANFWFQYKVSIISIILVFIILSVLIAQCSKRINYDIKVVYFAYNSALDVQTNAIAKYFEKYANDINNDGEVNVQVINCSFTQGNNPQYRDTMLSKLQATIVSDQEAMLFITDEESIKFFENASIGEIFDLDAVMLGEDFYKETENEKLGMLPPNLSVRCRKISDTLIENKGNAKKMHKEAMKILDELKKNYQ